MGDMIETFRNTTPICAQMFEGLKSKQGQKNNTKCPKKTLHVKISSKRATIYEQDVKTTSKVFFISDVSITDINLFQSSKILHVAFSGDT